MRCPICNADNPPEAGSCVQCGFGLSLSQPVWPDLPMTESPEPADVPRWPELPEIRILPMPSQPAWPKDDTLTASLAEAVKETEEDEAITTESAASPGQPTEDDELARLHIARGFEAIREGLLEQAQWEFEQARDVADDLDIVRMAQTQLRELQTREAGLPHQVQPVKRPSLPLAPSAPIGATDWRPTISIGLKMAALNGVFATCGVSACLGLLLTPLFGFVTGWLVAQKADKSNLSSDAIHAIIAGGITGLGGGLGQTIGHTLWATLLTSSEIDYSSWSAAACLLGAWHIPVSTAVSVLGWRVGVSRKRSGL